MFFTLIISCGRQSEFETRLEACLNLRAEQKESVFYDREVLNFENPIHDLEKELLSQNGFQDNSKESYKKLLERLRSDPNSIRLNLDSTKADLLRFVLLTPANTISDLSCYELLVNIKKINDKPFQEKIYHLLLQSHRSGDFLTYEDLQVLIDLIPNAKFNQWIYRHPIIHAIYARQEIKN